MPGTPPTTTKLALPRFAQSDPATFSSQVNSVSDKVEEKLGNALVGPEKMRIVRGAVAPGGSGLAGTVLYGEGFTSEVESVVGGYRAVLVFSVAFSGVPTVTASLTNGTDHGITIIPDSVAAEQAKFRMQDVDGDLFLKGFQFIAVGPIA